MRVLVKMAGVALDPGPFELVAEPATTISQLKARLNTEHGVSVTGHELIYGGKLIKDAQTLEDASFDESSFLACVPVVPNKMHPALGDIPADSTEPQPVSRIFTSFEEFDRTSIIAAELHLLPFALSRSTNSCILGCCCYYLDPSLAKHHTERAGAAGDQDGRKW
jgi:hypothetical protein